MKRLDVKRQLSAKSERVKAVDLHPREPWLLSCLYDGHIFIWNTQTKALVKSFEVCQLPVRCGAFIARKSWLVCGSDDMQLRVYNYNTSEKVHQWEGHQDYIRSLAAHPSQPFILSSSDDMLIKLWNWDENFTCTRVFEGHMHYVMQVCFNPKDPNVFASASLDRTIKVWSLGSPEANFTLEGHEKGVNCLSYYPGGDKPYLISGSDDLQVRVWDYQNKKCIQTMEGHSNNVTVVGFHPSLPIILSGSEDGTVRVWHADTYRLEKTLNYGFDRVWCMGFLQGSNQVAFGYDEGSVVIKIGSEEPCVSMDRVGKIVWSQQSDILQGNLQRLAPEDLVDGERVQMSLKDLGRCEIYPQGMMHNANGRFVAVVGDGEYIIYTALAWRNKAYGSGLDFAWASDAKIYGVRESSSKIKVFASFKETLSFRPSFSAEGIFGGGLLGVRSSKFVCLYDWADGTLVRRIDVLPKALYWSDNGDFLVIACESNFYVLRYNAALVAQRKASASEDEGIEGAFDVLHEINESVVSGAWVGDCFLYANTANRLNYAIGGEVVTVAHLEGKLFILGYLPKVNRVFLSDKNRGVTSYVLHVSVVNYQSAVLRGDLEAAAQILPSIPQDHHERVAQFLEAQGHKELALQISTDPDRRFELALQLDRLDIASNIAEEGDSDYKWKQLADLAFAQNKLGLAEKALQKANDLNGLLLLYLACANGPGLRHITQMAAAQGKNNVAFATLFLQNKLNECLALLCATQRFPEAALLARTYVPSQASAVVAQWKEHLSQQGAKGAAAAERLADPAEYPNLFPGFESALKQERKAAAAWTERVAGDYGKEDSPAPAADSSSEDEQEQEPEPEPEPEQEQEAAPAEQTAPAAVEQEPVPVVAEEAAPEPVVVAQEAQQPEQEAPAAIVEESPASPAIVEVAAEPTGDLLGLGLEGFGDAEETVADAPAAVEEGDLLGFGPSAAPSEDVSLAGLDLDWPEDAVEEEAEVAPSPVVAMAPKGKKGD